MSENVIDTNKASERLSAINKLRNSVANSYHELCFRADAYLALDCVEEALEDYDRAIALQGTQTERRLSAHLNRFAVLVRLDRTDRMIAAANDMLMTAPGLAVGYFYLGVALSRVGRDEESVEAYTRAIELAPKDPGTYVNRSAGYSSMGLADKCLADCERALSLKPGMSSAMNNKALALRCLGEPVKAIRVCNDALAIEPDSPLLYCNRAMANFALNNTRQAFADIDLSIRFAKKAMYVAKCKAIKAKFLIEASGGGGNGGDSGNPGNGGGENSPDFACRMIDEARELCDSAVRMAPENSHPWRYAWSTSALVSGKMGDLDAANRNVQLVLDRFRGFIYGINIKAQILLMQDRLDEALITVNSALSLNPKDPESNYIRYSIRSKQNDPRAKEDLNMARQLGYRRDP
jgi:tetratricopeptide (TPR) repeat protein